MVGMIAPSILKGGAVLWASAPNKGIRVESAEQKNKKRILAPRGTNHLLHAFQSHSSLSARSLFHLSDMEG